MRAFLGIAPNRQAREELVRVQERLKPYAQSNRWKDAASLHLTLQFLGEISNADRMRIDRELEEICDGRDPFGILIGKPGIFGEARKARTLWIGPVGENEALLALQKEIEKTLTRCGFPAEEKPFRPHITLAQTVAFSENAETVFQKLGALPPIRLQADRVFLFESREIAGRRVYTKESEYLF